MLDTKLELKNLIIETLNLEDLTPQDIQDDAPLFGEGLGLDSIDALELGVAIKKKYDVTIDSQDPLVRQHFSSISNLAKFIDASRR